MAERVSFGDHPEANEEHRLKFEDELPASQTDDGPAAESPRNKSVLGRQTSEGSSPLPARPASSLRTLGRKARPRTAMGVTIGEPLTVLAEPSPGPQYDVKDAITRPKSAAYSIKAPYKFRADSHPGPDKYDTSKDIANKTRGDRPKSVAFKAKGHTAPYHPRHDFHVRYGPGSGYYQPRVTDTGRQARKSSFGVRHKAGIHAGPANRTIPPTDTHGFDTPGPSYSPADEVGTSRSFGLAKIYSYETYGPGPLREDVGDGINFPPGVSHQLALKLEKSLDISSPGPADYAIPSNMGQAPAKSVFSRRKTPRGFIGPSACEYDPQRVHYPPAHSLPRRTFERDEVALPGPLDYDTRFSEDGKPIAPEYVVGERCKPVYPDILQYPEKSMLTMFPSPNEHGSIRDFAQNSKPAYSLRSRHEQRPRQGPAPNQYRREHHSPAAPHAVKAPDYSMGRSLEVPWNRRGFCPRGANEGGPGPEYLPNCQPCQRRKPAHSFGIKHHPGKLDSASPGPKYGIGLGTTRKGSDQGKKASFKGRQSNFVFQGHPPRPISAFA